MSELALVNQVELRIALASSDAQLEHSLKIYLAPLLLKLSSRDAEVRQTVLKVIENLTPRINAARTIQLPVEALVAQAKSPKTPVGTDALTVRVYSLVFAARGVDRMDEADRRQLVPKVLEGISTQTDVVAARLFYILCKLLQTWKAPERHSPEHEAMAEFLHLTKDDEAFVIEKIGKFLMLQPNANAAPVQSPGLSVEDSAFFTTKAGITYPTAQDIFAVKRQLLEFLKAGFSNTLLAVPLLIASVDESSAINDDSEIRFKKLNVNTEDPALVTKLIDLFVGTAAPAVKPTLQEKILSLLSHSVYAASSPRIAELLSLGLASSYPRLKQAAVAFIKWISTRSDSAKQVAADYSSNMAAQLKNNLLGEGWPQMDMTNKNYSTAIKQRALQYEALGNILRSSPELIGDWLYIEFLFESLEGEHSDLRSSIQDALSGLTVHLPGLSAESKASLKTTAYKYLNHASPDHNIHSCRFVAIKYVCCAYPFLDADARFLCVLGTTKENRPDTIEEALKGLHPHWFNILQSSNTLEFKATPDLLGENSRVEFPSFDAMVASLVAGLANESAHTIMSSLGQGIAFTVQTLVMQAISGHKTVVVADEQWAVRLDKALELDDTVRQLVVKHIPSETSFSRFVAAVLDAFTAQYQGGRVASNEVYGSYLIKLVSMAPATVVGELVPKLPNLVGLLQEKALSDTASLETARAIGIIGSHPLAPPLLDKLDTNVPSYLLGGYILTRAFLVSRLVARGQEVSVVSLVELLLDAAKVSMLEATVHRAIAQLAVYGALQGIDKTLFDQLVAVVAPKVKKCDERAVIAYAGLSLNAPKSTEANQFEQLIYDTHTSKQIEYTFTSGEALTIVAGGWESGVLRRELDIEGATPQLEPNTSRVPVVLSKILEACANTKPSLRKAGCIWLLSFAQYLGHTGFIKERARDIHIAFMRFLADRDELVQEAASRGLSLVYEMGDADLKDTLVKGLLKSFTDTNASLAAGTVDQDTELFDKDVLKTGDGLVSTYKDVLNLASDVGDPSLVYKFMLMAKSSALWSSRKGMAFGLGLILSKSSLDEMLTSNNKLSRRLIPKLYRYKFDPSTLVSKSMNDIWNALVKDSAQTVEAHFEDILNELLKTIGSREWRVRQASTTALNDLLQIVELEKYESRLEEIWNMSFRAMDDIKESVRKEGAKLTRALLTILTRTADVSRGVSVAKAQAVLGHLIPFLLGLKGLQSDAEDIRNFALETILKLCKIGGAAIRPFVPELLDNFIALMSMLEPEVVNYLVLNADKYNLKNNEIDAKRLQSLGNSPMMDAIEKLLDLVDEDLMPQVVKVLRTSIKKLVGLPSKVSGSRVLVTLVTKHYGISKPHGDKLFKVCVLQVYDKNDTIASSYATAAGYLCRIASVDAIVEYSHQLQDLYFKGEDERHRDIAAIACEGVSKYSNDKFDSVASAFLPLAYIGKHDHAKSVASVFERTWIECASGNSAVRLYLEEICKFAEEYLNSNQYQVRQTIATAIADMCTQVDTIVSPGIVELLFNILIQACQGKSWLGKEYVLEALVTFATKFSLFLTGDLVVKVNKVVSTEAKRRNKEYQKHAVKLAGKYLHHVHDDELLTTYIDIMTESILTDDYYVDDDMEDVRDSRDKVDTNKNLAIEEERLAFVKSLFETVSETNVSRLAKPALEALANIFQSGVFENTWRSKVVANECLRLFLDAKFQYDDDVVDLVMGAWNEIYKNSLTLSNIERVKIDTIRNAKRLKDVLEDVNAVTQANKVQTQLKIYNNVETSSIVKREIDLALQKIKSNLYS